MADTNHKVETTNDFNEYRKNMHRDEQPGRSVVPAPKKAIGVAFGIFMILVYVGVGVLLIINFFNWDASFTWVRWVLGVLLIIYGFFRGYRQFKGTDYYGN